MGARAAALFLLGALAGGCGFLSVNPERGLGREHVVEGPYPRVFQAALFVLADLGYEVVEASLEKRQLLGQKTFGYTVYSSIGIYLAPQGETATRVEVDTRRGWYLMFRHTLLEEEVVERVAKHVRQLVREAEERARRAREEEEARRRAVQRF